MSSSPPLLASLLRAWDRALATSAAADLPREFVDVLLPLMPEAAPDILRALVGQGLGFAEAFLLIEHAPLLGRHARDLFLERVFAVRVPVSPAELIAEAALGVAPDERGPFRAAALAALAAIADPDDRLCARLRWAQAEPEEAARALTAEALAELPHVSQHAVARLVRVLRGRLDPTLRAALLAHAEALPRADLDAEILLARCELSGPEERVPLALRAVERASKSKGRDYSSAAHEALDLVGFAPLRPWFERYLRGLKSPRDLKNLLVALGPHMPPEMLDRAERRLRSLGGETWRFTATVAELSLHHGARREALRDELRTLLARVVGDPLRGHQMGPDEYCEYDNLDSLRAWAAMHASAAFEGDERRSWQLRALAIVEGADTGVEAHYDFESLPWDTLGAALDPSLHAEAARVALAIRHRPTALKALGELVAALPESARHLALSGLARLADGASPEGLARALAALDAAASLPLRPVARRAATDRAAAPWTDADAASLADFVAAMKSEGWYGAAQAGAFCGRLTPAAARRAAGEVLALDGYRREHLALALAAAPALADTAEREALVADLLVPRDRLTGPDQHRAQAIAAQVVAVCGEGDAAWAARLARYFDGHPWDVDRLLAALAAFAPVLRRAGDAELLRALAARLRTPIAPTELSRPWAQAAQGAFDA